MKTTVKIIFLLLLIPITAIAGNSAGKKYLMRFPDVHKNTVVFVYGEDIWKVPVNGGTAVRLTINNGEERYPKFSPDGKRIAFTGDYDGNPDVYVMNTGGGEITRVTYHPGSDVVLGWHPKKKKILFRSRRKSFNEFYRLFLISPDGTGIETLILNEASDGSFSPEGTEIAYNKVTAQGAWKRYMGGEAREIYLYDFKTDEEINLTGFKGTDANPMWMGDTIYFSSDRNYRLNIYGYHTVSKKIRRFTFHDDYDVRRPSGGNGRVVYEKGGELWLLDTATGKTGKIPLEIRADAPEQRPYFKDVKKYITGFDISPSGQRALVVARGEVFTVPKKNGPTRNLTRDPGSRDKNAAWSPDGKSIAYLSDKSGEYEIYITHPKGKTRGAGGINAVKLTRHKDGYRRTLRWSPDSKKIAFADQTLRCYYLDIKTKKITEVDKAGYENVDVFLDVKPIYDFTWSPDSRFIAYSKMDADQVNKIYIYALETGKIHCVSNGLFNDFNPLFSKDGKHLFFISNRRFSPTYCDFEWDAVYKDMAGIFCITLEKDGKSILPLLSDEEKTEPADAKKNEKKKTGPEKVTVKIDSHGISERVKMLPLPRGNYRNLAVNNTSIFYFNSEKGDYNRFAFRSLDPRDLFAFDFDKRKERRVTKKIAGYKLSFNGKYIIYEKNKKLEIIASGAGGAESRLLDLSGLKMHLDPKLEWRQMFNEAWRMVRDLFYDPGFRGLDWKAVGEKYRKLLPYATCRQDMKYIIAEMVAELSVSHTYVYGGDKRRAGRVNTGMLGADWQMDTKSKRYRFKKIYRVPDWSRNIIPPLYDPDIHVAEGDYLLAVDNVPVFTHRNIYSYFQGTAGKQVTILVNGTPSLGGAKEYRVKPLRDERSLRYLDWVEHNRLTVEKASNGRIGYIHFPDTFEESFIEFPKYYYSQVRKKGLVIDGRYNAGGLGPEIFFNRLMDRITSYWTRRYSHDQTWPPLATRAHLVCLTNKQAGSGGDEFPWLFKFRKMGPVIGTRTWGGLLAITTSIPLIDGGEITVPDSRVYDMKGKWMVENIGVEPDIVVELHPAEMARGYDAQLMKGVDYLLKKIKEKPRQWPKRGAYPKGSGSTCLSPSLL